MLIIDNRMETTMTRRAFRPAVLSNALPPLFFAVLSLLPLAIWFVPDAPRYRTPVTTDLAALAPSQTFRP